jgi:8-oxo-dGTP diphosphatase
LSKTEGFNIIYVVANGLGELDLALRFEKSRGTGTPSGLFGHNSRDDLRNQRTRIRRLPTPFELLSEQLFIISPVRTGRPMSGDTVAGVDWSGGDWLAIVFENEEPIDFLPEKDFSAIPESHQGFDRILIDVPIGLPHDDETLEKREKLDSAARTVTGQSSSVFPVPSRAACQKAMKGGDYKTVVNQNQENLTKGLTWQSYYIAAGIGEIDDFLKDNEAAKETIIESHLELCFRGLLGHQLSHSKKSAQGLGERFGALDGHHDDPEAVFGQLCRDLVGEQTDVDTDDVVDALGLAVVAYYALEELRSLPDGEVYRDEEGLPI